LNFFINWFFHIDKKKNTALNLSRKPINLTIHGCQIIYKGNCFVLDMDKRGLSGVVVTVLFILLALSSVVIVWGIISNFIGSVDLDATSITNQFSIVKNSVVVDNEGKLIELFIQRDRGRTALAGFILSLEDVDGKVISSNKLGVSSSTGFNKEKFTYDYFDKNLANLTSVAIIPVFLVDGEEKEGIVSDTYVISSGSSGTVTSVPTVSSTEFKLPGYAANVEDPDYGNGIDWASTNINNVKTDDGVSATVGISSAGGFSDLLVVDTFGFNVPENAEITGVEVQIKKSYSGNVINDKVVGIIYTDDFGDSVISSSNKAGVNWGTSLGVVIYGNSADLWGEDLTWEMINDIGFGVVLSVNGISGPIPISMANVDYIKMKVYYSA